MTDVLRTISTRETPQSEPAGRATVRNAAGGHGFEVDAVVQARHFLILGVSGGTYYVGEKELAREHAAVISRLAQSDPMTLVDMITEISLAGRAPKQEPGLFALAVAASPPTSETGRAYALAALPKVCRTATQLFLFVTYAEQFRGRGPALRRAIARWYTEKPADKLAYQVLKYRSR
jgi:60 kDa SS-A/Ro ribonucleoprotein